MVLNICEPPDSAILLLGIRLYGAGPFALILWPTSLHTHVPHETCNRENTGQSFPYSSFKASLPFEAQVVEAPCTIQVIAALLGRNRVSIARER